MSVKYFVCLYSSTESNLPAQLNVQKMLSQNMNLGFEMLIIDWRIFFLLFPLENVRDFSYQSPFFMGSVNNYCHPSQGHLSHPVTLLSFLMSLFPELFKSVALSLLFWWLYFSIPKNFERVLPVMLTKFGCVYFGQTVNIGTLWEECQFALLFSKKS